MAAGNTITGSLTDSLPYVIASARIVREQMGQMPQLVDRVTLDEGTGLNWNEVSFDKLDAQAVTETTELDNPQQISDTLLQITPTVVGIQTLITDRVGARLARKAFARIGELAQNAIQRKKNEDGLIVFEGAGTTLGSAGTTMTSGHVSAASVRITSDISEPGMLPLRGVFHGFTLRAIEVELLAGMTVSNAEQLLTDGISAEVYRQGYRGMIRQVQLFENGEISVDVNDDARGGVFSRDAIVLVQGRRPRKETRREPHIGGGATSVFLYDEYAYGERSPGNWLVGMLFDATVPTS